MSVVSYYSYSAQQSNLISLLYCIERTLKKISSYLSMPFQCHFKVTDLLRSTLRVVRGIISAT